MKISHFLAKKPGCTVRSLSAAPIVTILSVLLLSGCGDDNESGDAGGDSAAETLGALPDDLEPGASRLSISGAVTDAGEYTTDVDERYGGASVDRFRPTNDGSNADGPYTLRIYTDATHQDDPDDVVRAWISLALPVDVGPGVYGIATSRDAADDEAVAVLAGDGYAWQFNRNVTGTLQIEEIGEQISALWEFQAFSGGGDDAPSVEVSGAVNQLAFQPQAEARFAMSANGETEHLVSVGANTGGNSYTLRFGRDVYFAFEPDFDEGTYAFGNNRGDGIVGLMLPDHSFDDVDGELVLERVDGAYSGTFSLITTGDQPVTLEGRFDHVAGPDAG